MRRIALIRRRDGDTEPFDQDRVVDAVGGALLAAGKEDRLLAAEIAAVVGLFLEKTYDQEIPDVNEVEDMVEKVLIETGHASAAKAFILHRERRSRQRLARDAVDPAGDPTLFGPRVIQVEDPVADRSRPFSREGLGRLLAADGLIPRDEAAEIAARVEERLRRAGVARATSSLVRALADVEVFERTLALDLRRPTGVAIPPEAVAESLLRRGVRGGAPFPAVAARELGGVALRSHALTELLPPEVARAHLSGELHVHGLDAPMSLFSACFTPEDVKNGTVPGGGTRGVREAAASARRLAAALGRSVRCLQGAVTAATSVGAVPVSFAPLLLEIPRDEMAEEAWHLLFETSAEQAGRRVELDLSPDVADVLADTQAVDGAGNALQLPNAELAELATAFAGAVLRAHAKGAGLPARDALPVLSVEVSERTLGGNAADIVRQAAEVALRGDRVVFALSREGNPRGGTSLARPPTSVGSSGFPRSCCAGRVTLNLPRAALRAGRGNVEGFLRLCDRLVDLAADAHRTRRELLAQVAGRAGGSMAPLFRRARGRAPLYDLSQAWWSFGITGLNEALMLLTGFELHEDRETAARVACTVVEYLSLKVRAAGAAGDFPASLDADEDPHVAGRLLGLDRQLEPERVRFPAEDAYTRGVATRADAPVDPLCRVEREESIHRHLTTATLRIPLAADASGGADGLIALLGKLLRAGNAGQVEFALW